MIKFESHLSDVIKQIENTNKRNLRDATITLYRAVKKKFTGKRSGKMYKKPGFKNKYQASAPGEAPANRTGALSQNIKYVVDAFIGRVGTDNDYAIPLEFGTSTMKPRPFIGPAVVESQAEIIRIMGRP